METERSIEFRYLSPAGQISLFRFDVSEALCIDGSSTSAADERVCRDELAVVDAALTAAKAAEGRISALSADLEAQKAISSEAIPKG